MPNFSEPLGLCAALVDLQLRFLFNDYLRGGIGGYLGLAFGTVAQSTSVVFCLGPSITPLSVEFLEHHEIGLRLGASFGVLDGAPQSSALLSTRRYIYCF